MGEKIKDLSKFKIRNTEVAIELNDGYAKDYSQYDIHIQSDAVQFYLSESDFMKLASSVITAKRRFDSLKNFD